MSVDSEESRFERALRFAGLKVMSLESYSVGCNLSIIACTSCEGGVYPKSTIPHVQSHGIKLTKEHISDLTETIPTLNLVTETKFLPSPPHKRAPVDSIRIHEGFLCSLCIYSGRTPATMDSHWSSNHRDQGGADYSQGKVQTIFDRHPQYFTVLPTLKGLGPQDKYRLYLEKFSSEIEIADTTFIPAISEHEIPPLLRITLWHEHLSKFTNDKASVRAIRFLVDTHHAGQTTPWLGKQLYTTISDYMQDIKAKMKKVPIPARMLLIQYPV
jgi:hypothetical protein